jgi:lysyl-tRNA synthetase class 2
MSHVPTDNRWLARLRDRAAMLEAVRRFFSARAVLEVDCPACTVFPAVDAHIDLFKVCGADNTANRYLHSSPEYGMKRLLAAGSGDIYQLSHVFRVDEQSERHNPEFTMVEWYRCGFSLDEMIAETAALAILFCGELSCRTISYRAALRHYAGIDYAHASNSDLVRCLEKHGIEPSADLREETTDNLLNLLLGTTVEPYLGHDELTFIVDYPVTQGALAQTTWSEGIPVARRFELYYKGIELANGYQELQDAEEQRQRFAVANEERVRLGKEPLPVDEYLLKDLAQLPACCGVAVGFDRLMMVRQGATAICEVLPFVWDEA